MVVVEEVAAPGKPYGLTVVGNELRVVVSIGEDDDRYLYRFVPGQGFDAESKTACPDFTGSHLASDGTTLYLGPCRHRLLTVCLQTNREVSGLTGTIQHDSNEEP